MRKFGLIGYPLGHSFSKRYFTEKFVNEGIENAVYENYPIDSISKLQEIIRSDTDIIGLNVTIPYKQQVIPFLDTLDEVASKIGAVNTIKIDQKTRELSGFNSDYFGFRDSISPHLDIQHKKALILGTGGASKAVCQVLMDMGIESLFVSRNSSGQEILTYKDLNRSVLEQYFIIINCSPLGTFPNIDEAPDIPYNLLTPNHLLYDLVYNPPKTRFLMLGEKHGAKILNGYQMLVLQAEKSWEIWNRE